MRSHSDEYTSFNRLYALVKRMERRYDRMGEEMTVEERTTLAAHLRKIATKIEAKRADASENE